MSFRAFCQLFRRKTEYQKLIEKAEMYEREASKNYGRPNTDMFIILANQYREQALNLTVGEALR